MTAVERAMRRQKKLILSGRCICCASKLPLDYKHKQCSSCLEKRRQHQHSIRQTRIDNNLCPKCGKRPPADGFTLCGECHERGAGNMKRLTESRKTKGLCCFCGKRPLVTAFYCALCYEKKKKDNKLRRIENGEYKAVPAEILKCVRRFFGLKNMIGIHKSRLQAAYINKKINVAIGHVRAIKTCKTRLLKEFGYDIEDARSC